MDGRPTFCFQKGRTLPKIEQDYVDASALGQQEKLVGIPFRHKTFYIGDLRLEYLPPRDVGDRVSV